MMNTQHPLLTRRLASKPTPTEDEDMQLNLGTDRSNDFMNELGGLAAMDTSGM